MRRRGAPLLLALMLWVGLASSAQAARSTVRHPLQAFLLSSAPDSLSDLRIHLHEVKVVYPTYFDCTVPAGQISGVPSPTIDTYAAHRHLTLMPRFNCQDMATVHRILTEPQLRAETLLGLQRIGSRRAYAGINLDLENDGAGDRGALTSFVGELAARLHAHGRKLAVDVDGVTQDNPHLSTWFYDDRALAAAADTVFVIAWGTHWAGSLPGPIGSLPFVNEVASYVASLPNARKFVLGVPMYGLDWPAGGGPAHQATAYQYSGILKLVSSIGARPTRDPLSDEMGFNYEAAGVAHQVWYLDARAVVDRLRVARAHGLAAGVWRLGAEDQALWRSSAIAH